MKKLLAMLSLVAAACSPVRAPLTQPQAQVVFLPTFSFTNDAPIVFTSDDQVALPQYAADRFNEAVSIVQFVRTQDGKQTFTAFAGWKLPIHLLPDAFKDPSFDGDLVGLMVPPLLGKAVDAQALPYIKVSVPAEFDDESNQKGKVLRHEMVHWIMFYQPGVPTSDWETSLHGEKALDTDPVLRAIREFIDWAYPAAGHSYFPKDFKVLP